MSNYKITYSNELYHHGIKGQKWGQRRFQNEDGSLTAAGKQRYGYSEGSENYRAGMLKATSMGGVLGGALYKARHKEEAAKYAEEKRQIKQNKRDDKAKAKAEKEALKEERKNYLDSNGKMRALDSDSSTTKKVKEAWNNMSDSEFRKVYGVDKNTYAKRVQKYGDPYMNSPLAKAGKRINKTAYGKVVNKVAFSEKRNTRKMAQKAARKIAEGNAAITSVSRAAATAAFASGHPIGAAIIRTAGAATVVGHTYSQGKKAAGQIRESNEYLRKQKEANS